LKWRKILFFIIRNKFSKFLSIYININKGKIILLLF
jgi:hypothetical protein